MFKTLLKSRFSAFWASFSGAGANKKKKQQSMATKVLLILLFVFLAGYLAVAFGAMAFGMDIMAKETGDFWVSQTLGAMVASLFCIVGSVFTAKTQIFESKDNELLLAMPIPPRYIFLSRITMLLVVNYALEALVMLPVIFVHTIVVGYSPLGALFTLLVFIMLPFFTLTLSVLLAWVISAVSARLKNKTVISVLFTVFFLVIYFVACGAFGGFIGASGDEEANIDFSGLKKTYIFYWMGSAMSDGNALSFLFFALCTIIPALLTFYLLNRSFVKIITTNTGVKKIKYVAKEAKTSTQEGALVKKELKRFFSSSAYILNAGMGNIMTVILAVMAALLSSELMLMLEQEPMLGKIIPTVVAMIIIFSASMNLVSAPSISLEDKCLWILQSAPIEPKKVLMSKIYTHIIICEPLTLISSIIVAIAFKFSALNFIAIILTSLSMVALTGFFGLFLGLKFPKFDWQNETVAVKQGFAVFGAMFGTMIWTMLFLFAGILFAILGADFWIVGLAFTVVNSAICIAIGAYFSRGGAHTFANLKH
ncbi:MAG: hypothetical protein J6A54_04370 [Clostridia bacterium]|nr:hypothetical protein [Clostridia bacterium]